jgi:DNA invertase Pin-like site-specific DNA recombinase
MPRKRTRPLTVGYLRVSTSQHQSTDSQRLNILEYCRRNDLKVDRWIETEMSSRRDKKARKLDELFSITGKGDLLIVSELSRLGRSVSEIVRMVEDRFVAEGRRLICVKEGLQVTDKGIDPFSKAFISIISVLSELEKELISERVRNGLQVAKKRGKTLGRKKGELQHVPLDEHKEKILELLELGVTPRRIAMQHLNVEPPRLYYWLKSRGVTDPNQKDDTTKKKSNTKKRELLVVPD